MPTKTKKAATKKAAAPKKKAGVKRSAAAVEKPMGKSGNGVGSAPAPAAAAVESIETDVDVIAFFDPSELVPYPDVNPRTDFDEEDLTDLADSIRVNGVLEPILVHDTGAVPYFIVAGERRWRAAKLAGRKIPAIVRTIPYTLALRLALIENMQRAQLTVLEEARAFDRMLKADPALTEAKLGIEIGKSQSYVSNRRRLLKLPAEVLKLVTDGELDQSAARDLLLPFANIPEKKRDALYGGFVKEFRQHSKQAPLTDHDITGIVINVARDLGNELITDRTHTDGDWYKGSLVTVEEHAKECSCGGPTFRYDRWGGAVKTVRCFDDDWWKAKNAAAWAKREQKKKDSIARAVEKAFELQGRPMLKADVFHKKYGYGNYETVQPTSFVDPSLLPAESLIFVEREKGRRPNLVCVDKKAFAAAQRPLNREKKELAEQRRQQRAQHELELAKQSQVEPWMIREILEDRPSTEQLQLVARDHGIDLGKHGEVYTRVKALPDDQVVLLFKVVGMRARAGALPYSAAQDPIEKEVEQEIAARYRPLIEALLPTQQVAPEITEQLTTLEADLRNALDAARRISGKQKSEVPADEARQVVKNLENAQLAVGAFEKEHPAVWLPPSLESLCQDAEWEMEEIAYDFDVEEDEPNEGGEEEFDVEVDDEFDDEIDENELEEEELVEA